MLSRFHDGQRVVVDDPTDRHAALRGWTGKVTRVLMRSAAEAWVQMDKRVPEELAEFPRGDSREDHVLLHAGEVSPARRGAGRRVRA